MKGRISSTALGAAPGVALQHASALAHDGNSAAAAKIYRGLLESDPRHFEALYRLAEIELAAERPTEAVALLRKALNQQPNMAPAHAMLAFALQNLQRTDEAFARAKRALALDPHLPEAHLALARTHSDLGRHGEAIAAAARALALAPHRPDLYYHLGYIMRWNAGDPRIAALAALARSTAALSFEDQVYLNFALAKVHADCGDIEESFRFQLRGAALRRESLRYDEAKLFRQGEEICRYFDAEWISRHEGAGEPSRLPVLIVGMPRSGSTLVEQVLASHRHVHALGETATFREALAQSRGKGVQSVEVAAPWSEAELKRLGALYVEAGQRGAPASTARFVDKMLNNSQVVGLIHAALPNARIIHTCRDPVDTCLSAFSILFHGAAQPYSYDLGELGRYYRAYETMMAHWRDVLPAGVMLEVRYEEMVDDFERQARRIVAHCGLEWDDACLEFHKTDRPVRTASHAQVRQPIYRSSVGRPRPPRELLFPLLDALGRA